MLVLFDCVALETCSQSRSGAASTALVLCAVSAGAAEQDAVVELIIAKKDRLAGKTVYIDLFGGPKRTKFVDASEDGLTVSAMGNEMALPWDQLSARRLGSVASKGAESFEEHAVVVRFYASAGMKEEAEDGLVKTARLFGDRADDVAALQKELFPEPERPKPPRIFVSERPKERPRAGPSRAPLAPNPQSRWETVGPGGGGSIYYPSISPHNPDLAFVCCDMGGFYRTTDGGRSWRMLDQAMIRRPWCFTVFHPQNPNLLFSGGRNGITMSVDSGLSWQAVGSAGPPSSIAFDPGNPNVMYASLGRRFSPFEHLGHGETSARLLRSTNGGRGWGAVSLKGVPSNAFIFYVHVDATSPPQSRTIFLGTVAGVFRSTDGGQSWQKRTEGLSSDRIVDMAAYSNAKDGKCVLYVTVPSRKQGGEFSGGVSKSTDRAETWEPKLKGLNTALGRKSRWGAGDIAQYGPLGISAASPDVVYVSCRGTDIKPPHASGVYRTDNGGESWRFVQSLDRRWGGGYENGWVGPNRNSNFSPYHVGVNPERPTDAMVTGSARALRTKDGGGKWYQVYTRKAGKSWGSAGLEVTTCYYYDVHPYEKNRHYISYTDIGFFRSEDGGRSWIHVLHDELPWRNTCYDLAVDPQKPKMLYLAMANFHDLPAQKMLVTNPASSASCVGGGYISNDYGATMQVVGQDQGLPNRPCTSILLDPLSPPDARTLYVCVYSRGVFKSTDGGKRWTRKNGGLGTNLNAWRIDMAPDGTLFLGMTRKMHGGNEKGALYKSTDGAESWAKLRDFGWLHDVRVLPTLPETARGVAELVRKRRKGQPVPYTLFVGNYGRAGDMGGLYASRDGGATFNTTYSGDVWCVSVFNDRPGVIYAGTPRGLHLSTSGGAQWKEIKGIPFRNLRRVTFDPADDTKIYVTSFGGGVWHGPAAGTGQ